MTSRSTRRSKDFFVIIQKKLDIVIPQCLVVILTKTGYDSELCIQSLNADTIDEIEKHINKKRSILNGVHLPDAYDTTDEFKFLPGHKTFLMQFAQRLQKYSDKQSAKYTIQSVDPTEMNLGDAVLKLEKKLIDKVIRFAKNKNIPINDSNFDVNCLQNSTIEYSNGIFRGKVVLTCPICKKKISVQLKKYWYTTNFDTHIKDHISTDAAVGTSNGSQISQNVPGTENTNSSSILKGATCNNLAENSQEKQAVGSVGTLSIMSNKDLNTNNKSYSGICDNVAELFKCVDPTERNKFSFQLT